MKKYYNMDLITVEDDCAIDAKFYFDKEVKRFTGYNLNDFKNNYEEKRLTQVSIQYIIEPYVIIFDGDDQTHKLYKIKDGIMEECPLCKTKIGNIREK